MTDQLCPIHNVEFRLIPAGVSKTKKNPDGTPKAYGAFYACPERDCREKPSKPQNEPGEAVAPNQVSSTTPSPKPSPEPREHLENTLTGGIALLHGKIGDLGARLDGIEAQQERIIKGIALVLSEVQGRFTDKEIEGMAEEID